MARPEKTFKAGAVRASVFLNTIERDGKTIPIRKVVLEVRYRDKSGEWKSSNSFSLNEIPKASTVLQQAYEYLLEQSSNDRASENASTGAGGSFASADRAGGQSPGSGKGPRVIGTYQG